MMQWMSILVLGVAWRALLAIRCSFLVLVLGLRSSASIKGLSMASSLQCASSEHI